MKKTHQKGGSVASDAVTSLVSAETYNQLNKNFTNHYGDSQCGGSRCKACGGRLGGKHKRHNKNKKGGDGTLSNMLKSFSSSASSALGFKSHFSDVPFTSSPAPAMNAVLPRNVGMSQKSQFVNAATTNVVKLPTMGGSRKKTHKGGQMRTMSDLMAHNVGSSYSIRNKQGGSSDAVSLNYNAVKTQGHMNGPNVNRAVTSTADHILASEAVSSFPAIQKYTQYGSPLDGKLPFTYSGEKFSVAPTTGGSLFSDMANRVKKVAKKVMKSTKTTKTPKSTMKTIKTVKTTKSK